MDNPIIVQEFFMLSIKMKEHLRRAVAARAPKYGAVAGGMALLLAASAFTGSRLQVVTISDTEGAIGTTITIARDLDDLLEQAGVTPAGSNDEMVLTTSDNASHLRIMRAYSVPVTVDGATVTLATTGETVERLLSKAGVALGPDDEVEPSLDTIVKQGEGILVRRVAYREYSQEETIPCVTEVVPTSLFYRAQDYALTVQEGSDGLDRVTYLERWVDGELVETTETARETLTEMVPGMVKSYGEGAAVSSFVGPEVVDGAPVEGVAAVYTNQRSTAYSSSSPTVKGASGRRLTYGTVAVDPNVIPYGSLMYIVSSDGKFVYGYAYAADTGTAMMEGRVFVDLYYEIYLESVKSAVIPVDVYVLDEETAARYAEANDAILAADETIGR